MTCLCLRQKELPSTALPIIRFEPNQINQSSSEDGARSEENYRDSPLWSLPLATLKQIDDDDDVNNGNNLHQLGSFNVTFSKML